MLKKKTKQIDRLKGDKFFFFYPCIALIKVWNSTFDKCVKREWIIIVMIIITFNSFQSSLISIDWKNNVKKCTVHPFSSSWSCLVETAWNDSLYWLQNSQSMFFWASIYCRDCKIITLNTIKNKETCVCLSEKKSDIDNWTLIIGKWEKKRVFSHERCIRMAASVITLIEEQNNHFFFFLSIDSLLYTIYRIISFMDFACRLAAL